MQRLIIWKTPLHRTWERVMVWPEPPTYFVLKRNPGSGFNSPLLLIRLLSFLLSWNNKSRSGVLVGSWIVSSSFCLFLSIVYLCFTLVQILGCHVQVVFVRSGPPYQTVGRWDTTVISWVGGPYRGPAKSFWRTCIQTQSWVAWFTWYMIWYYLYTTLCLNTEVNHCWGTIVWPLR